MRFTLTVAALSGIAVLGQAQDIKPAPVLNIIRETLKEGRGPAHEKVEAEYAATFRKANHPARYVALAAMSGASEVWFVEPMPSFAVNQEWEKASEKEPLRSALGMMESRDGELRASSRTMWAVYNPEMSYHPERFNPGKTRYVMAGVYRIKIGHDADLMAGSKAYLAAWEKAHLEGCTLAYQVVFGAPAGTYLFFSMMESMKTLDEAPARMQAIMQAMGADQFAQFMKGAGDLFVSMDETLLEVKPGMSYPPQQFIDADPGFWKPKATPKPAGPTSSGGVPAPEKKPQ
jgi:hypothetical protein